MPGNKVSTGRLSAAGKSNSVRGGAGSGATASQGMQAGSARPPQESTAEPERRLPGLPASPPQDIEELQGNPAPEPGRAPTGSGAAGSTAEAMDPVNMATGRFIYEDMDFILPDMGGEYGLARRYTGPEKKKPGRSLGKAWALSTDTYVSDEGGTATVTMPDGRTAEYTRQGSRYINKKGGSEKYTLEKTQAGYIFTDSTGRIKYYYEADGRVVKKADHNGNATEYIYSEYGIQKIMLPTGYYITFTWENMKISSATDSTGRTVGYAYEKGLLTKVTRCDVKYVDPSGHGKENGVAGGDESGTRFMKFIL